MYGGRKRSLSVPQHLLCSATHPIPSTALRCFPTNKFMPGAARHMEDLPAITNLKDTLNEKKKTQKKKTTNDFKSRQQKNRPTQEGSQHRTCAQNYDKFGCVVHAKARTQETTKHVTSYPTSYILRFSTSTAPTPFGYRQIIVADRLLTCRRSAHTTSHRRFADK